MLLSQRKRVLETSTKRPAMEIISRNYSIDSIFSDFVNKFVGKKTKHLFGNSFEQKIIA